ncbi:MAG: 3'(2'),5'-bisphosphate nucleotidase CysQ [Alphaproteobacteria bacterium]
MSSAEKLLAHPGALCNMVRRVAIDAGRITLDYFEMVRPEQVERKSNGSPVTEADRAAEDFIVAALKDIIPEIPVIAEESADAGNIPDLSQHDYFWLVDPLDATREFIAGGKNYTVNIGLICKGVPVLGVVYAPALGVLYAGHGEGTAVRWSEDTGKDKSITVRKTPAAGLTVMSSFYNADDTRMDKFLQAFKVEKILKRASSIKLCLVAEGKADMHPRLGTTCEWDTAAGEAVLRAAGGILTNLEGEPLSYGGVGKKFINPHFVASAFEWRDMGEEA